MAKYNEIRALADHHAKEVTRFPRDWMGYLDTAARLYRYDFGDTLLIHAQKPEAMACAELPIWNRLGRWVNRGAKGIALIDDSSPRRALRYVFDISDTHMGEGGKTPWLWQTTPEMEMPLLEHLTDTYGLDADSSRNLPGALRQIARMYAQDNIYDAMEGLEYEVGDSLLEGMDETFLHMTFLSLLEHSAFYLLARRCGLEPMEFMEPEDFSGITDFNTLSVLSFLGNGAHDIVEPVLRDIGRTLAQFSYESARAEAQKGLDNSFQRGHNEFNSLKRESETEKGDNGNDPEYGDHLPEERGLPDPEPYDQGESGHIREVRDAPEEFLKGEPEELVPEHGADREAGDPSPGDRPDSGPQDGGDHIPDGGSGERDREPEGSGPDGMDQEDEQYPQQGGRDRPDGIGLQLKLETEEQEGNGAEDENSSAFPLPDFPSVEQQKRELTKKTQALYAGIIPFPADVVDKILRTGSNHARSQLRIIYNFMSEQPQEDYTDFIRKEYGRGGKGFSIGGRDYSVWFDDLGMQIAVGHTVEDKMPVKAVLSWEDVSQRIKQLLQQGEYAPQAVLDAARENAIKEHAQVLAYMEREMDKDVSEIVFGDTGMFSGGFPDEVEKISSYLSQEDNVGDLLERLSGLAAAYHEEPSIMRSRLYAPDRVLAQFQRFAMQTIPFQARDGFAWEEHPVFITQDEIDAFLTRGGPYSNGRLSIYSFFLNHEDGKERANYLKNQYGTGGSSHALSGADDSHADHDGKGLRLERGDYGNPVAKVSLTWQKVAKRIDDLIRNDRYLTADDYLHMPVYEREQMASRVISFYYRLPDEIERPFTRDFFNDTARKEVFGLLEDPETAGDLLSHMDGALAALPLDYDGYDQKVQILTDLHSYVAGEYTIFPSKAQEQKFLTPSGDQMSIFDFFHADIEPEPAPEPEGLFTRNEGDFIYLDGDHLYQIEQVTESEVVLVDMEDRNLAKKNILQDDFDKELEKSSLNLHLIRGEKPELRDSRTIYKECLYTTLMSLEHGVGYRFLYEGDMEGGMAEERTAEFLDRLFEANRENAPLFAEAYGQWEDFRKWMAEDVLYHLMDIQAGRRDAVMLYQDDPESPEWVRGNEVFAPRQMILHKDVEMQPSPEETVEESSAKKDLPDQTGEIRAGDQEIEDKVFQSMLTTRTTYEDYSPEQMDVIYQAAEDGRDLQPLLNPEFSPEQMQLIADIQGRMEAYSRASFHDLYEFITHNLVSIDTINTLRAANQLPLEGRTGPDISIPMREVVIDLTPQDRREEESEEKTAQEPVNFRITDDNLGTGGPKTKFRANMEAIYLLKKLEAEGRLAAPEEQEVLSRYVGWGGIPQAFDANNREWSGEAAEVKAALTAEEYRDARASTLNAFYTSPTVIRAMYEALSNMGLSTGNALEPSCGVGNFLGLVPDSMDGLRIYGVELDSISGRIARQLYQKNEIAVQGFEETEFPDSFFDCVIGNVPFGQYKVNDRRYDRHNFLIHDYFIARSLDLTRPGGVVAVVTSSGTMDKKNEGVREYLANRADLLGAIRLPNNAFMRNANTGVVADILFFQKRDRAPLTLPDWVHLSETPEGHLVNSYFARHPEMVLGEFTTESTQYGRQEVTVKPIEGADLASQLQEAVSHIRGTIEEVELTDSELDEERDISIPADPSVKNFSFTNVDGDVYYRENSRMRRMDLPARTTERVLGMIGIRNATQELLDIQMEDGSDAEVELLQKKLTDLYDTFTAQYGLVSSTANRRAFSQDSSYCLLASLEVLDEEGKLLRKADIFTKRTIRRPEPVTEVDTPSEALALSIGERARVDLPFMSGLCGKSEEEIVHDLTGVIFRNPLTQRYETSDEYLSGNVREKLWTAREFAERDPAYQVNVEYLTRVQPKDLDASEIEVRLGATWIKPEYVQQFMVETFQTPWYLAGKEIQVEYSPVNGQWHVSGNTRDSGNALVNSTYGTGKATAYRLLEDALNLKDTKLYDIMEDIEGKEHRVLNKKETMLAQQKQGMIREAFKEWIFRDMDRREDLCRTYNELFNSIRPREYDGSHIRFVGMTPEITLMDHQKNAVAHILYGDNTLLAHCVGAGKTFQMIAAGMESKRLGLAQKCLYVVPNHLTEQWGSDFLRLYPGANILVATKKDFEPANRKKFCSRIATGDYDAVIIGHTQFERIPLSRERQIASIERQIDDIEMAIEEAAVQEGSRYTIKQMEKTRKSLEARLDKLNNQEKKDDVVIFEQLGVDRLFVDESHNFKNLFLYTKMRNVAGISQTDAQKSSDMLLKCQYMDELTGGKGVTFATGTPVSNSMVELYTIMRYLQYDTLQKMGLGHFDSWAAAFGETVTAIELSPEGTGYRAKTRFARFFNLPELISLFKESADVQTADMLKLPVPEAEYINEVLQPSEIQKEMVSSFAERAEDVRNGGVDAKVDNMLKITNDGRKCALDQRLMNDMLPDEEDSKVNRCVKNAYNVWEETAADRSTQLIFCDLSTPKADGSFNVYDDIREKLVAKGIPREEIAFIHDANTEARKAELFARVRSGQVRILLGSTPKLGAGTNVQDRLIALHHLDCPWKPSDVGRILRTFKIKKNVEVTDNGKIII